MYVVVAYDIADDKRRRRLADRLIDFLPRVQMSVFEGEIPAGRLPELRETILDQIDPEEDAVRIYRLCRGCARVTESLGRGPSPGEGDDLVIG